MPQVFKIAGYTVYFWVNENDPLEPVHVHIAKGVPSPNATKVWITKNGKCLLCNNNSKIPEKQLRVFMQIIEARSKTVLDLWYSTFRQISFYCYFKRPFNNNPIGRPFLSNFRPPWRKLPDVNCTDT